MFVVFFAFGPGPKRTLFWQAFLVACVSEGTVLYCNSSDDDVILEGSAPSFAYCLLSDVHITVRFCLLLMFLLSAIGRAGAAGHARTIFRFLLLASSKVLLVLRVVSAY